MKLFKPITSSLLLFFTTIALAHAADKPYPIDKASGLIMAPGWQLVNGQCNACHTSMIISQNRGNEVFWRDTIQWMIDTQGLWDLSDTWQPVLTYLSTYYGEKALDMKIYRRKPLESALLPVQLPPVK